GVAFAGMAIGAGAGAGLFGVKSAMGTMDKIQAQAQQYDLQKGAGKQMVQSAYVKGRIDGKQEGVFLGYQAGAGESMQVAQGHLADAYNHGVADMAQAVAQKFEGQARSKSEPPEMPQAEMPQASAEAPEGTSHSACCNRKSLKPNDLKGGISPEAIKDQQLNGASAEIGPR
ncbi:MAG: hypothetical protein JO089_03730, partial [Alphaproteobacteria bacterium]|nr:hypothetical protein [Alphaproteobacteria bacterium]